MPSSNAYRKAKGRARGRAELLWTWLSSSECRALLSDSGRGEQQHVVSRDWLQIQFNAHVVPTGSCGNALWQLCHSPWNISGGRFSCVYKHQFAFSLPPIFLPPQGGAAGGARRAQPPSAGVALVDVQRGLMRDKKRVTVDATALHGGELPLGAATTLTVRVANGGAAVRLLCGVRALVQIPGLEVPRVQAPVRLNAGGTHTLAVRFSPARLGVARTVLSFDFGDDGEGAFSIGRPVSLSVVTPEMEAIRPSAPYARPRRGAQKPQLGEYVLIQGERLPLPEREWSPPGAHELPQMYKHGSAADVLAAKLRAQLSWEVYDKHWRALLFAEEAQMLADIRAYDRSNQRLERVAGGYLRLFVAGLSENRPSVAKGDAVLVRAPGRAQRRMWEGIVHCVEQEAVLLKFDPRFHQSYVAGEAVDVRFTFKRMPLRLMHEALAEAEPASCAAAEALRPLVLPIEADLPSRYGEAAASHAPAPTAALRSTREMLNREQRAAVKQIVQREAPLVPYVVFGPPGTVRALSDLRAGLERGQPCGGTRAVKPVLCAAQASR